MIDVAGSSVATVELDPTANTDSLTNYLRRRGCTVHTTSDGQIRAFVTYSETVEPARWTRRLPISMKKSTYSRRSAIVSTVKKSTASMLAACARKNAHQERPPREPAGPRPASRRIFFTVVADTATPRPFSSPPIRW